MAAPAPIQPAYVRVSDHALVRWLERTGLTDIEALRSTLETSLARAAGAAMALRQDQYLIIADGLVYVVRESMVTTVLLDDGRKSHSNAINLPQPVNPVG